MDRNFSGIMFDIAIDGMGIDRTGVLMVGDRVSTDIVGARRAGIPSVLVKTGEFKASDLRGDVQPDYMVNAINEIETFF
jgi:ribonucleotide monophosphatase NagD (HAD superfamily)